MYLRIQFSSLTIGQYRCDTPAICGWYEQCRNHLSNIDPFQFSNPK